MELSSIRVHPVKSTAIRRVEEAYVDWPGLRGDREWMVVDATGEMTSARRFRDLFRIVARTAATGDPEADLVLEAPGMPTLEVSRPADGQRDVRMFRTKEMVGRPAGAEADAWLRTFLGRDDFSLVWCHDPQARALTRGGPGDHAAFQDGYPVTLISEESVTQVQAWMAEAADERGEEPPSPLSVDRFRPNLVVSGVPKPFAEDGWERVRIGDVVLRRAKLVDRCVMTTIDPTDLSRGKDPIRTLARHRSWDGATWCAVHYIPEHTGVVRVGDVVEPDRERAVPQ